MSESTTLVSARDAERLRHLLPDADAPIDPRSQHLSRLAASVDEGVMLAPTEIPPDVVTMNSVVRIKNLESGEISTYRLAFPKDADMKDRRLSVLAPIGAEMFGRRLGERFEVLVPSGQTRHFEVVEIVYQPEAAGDLDL